MKNVRIINEGLHRIGLVLGFLSLVFLPDIFFRAIDESNNRYFFWVELWELIYEGGHPLMGSALGVLSVLIAFAAGYFLIKIFEWIYKGFNNNNS